MAELDDIAKWIAESFYKIECETNQKIHEIYKMENLEKEEIT